jgi:hypothetical protein
MTFDPLSWALGFVLSRTTSKLLDKADLTAKLQKEIEAWANELPHDRSVVSAALFPDLCPNPVDRPALAALRQTLESDNVPSETQWLEAFLEQWHTIRSRGGDLQPFFTISEDDAKEHLEALARRVKQLCGQDERLFRGTALTILQEIAGSTKEDKIEKLRVETISVELVAILDLIALLAQDHVPSLGTGATFGERRRKVGVVGAAPTQLSSRVARMKLHLSSSTAEALTDFMDLLEKYISEARYVLPYPEDEKFSFIQEQDKLKKYEAYKWAIYCNWRTLKNRLLAEAADLADVEEIRNSDRVWQMIGFENQEAYVEYVSPRTESLVRGAGIRERVLLKVLLEKPQVSEVELRSEGFPKGIVVEVVNSLMRDSYLEVSGDPRHFSLSPLGKKILRELLADERARET